MRDDDNKDDREGVVLREKRERKVLYKNEGIMMKGKGGSVIGRLGEGKRRGSRSRG